MSHAAVDLLLRGYRAFVAGDLAAIEGMLDPEVEWIGVGEVAAIAERDDVLEILRDRLAEDYSVTVDRCIGVADDVVVSMRFSRVETDPTDERPLQSRRSYLVGRYAAIVTMHEGRVTRVVEYVHQRTLQHTNLFQQGADFIHQPQPHIERHLIVARTACVELGACWHATRQLCFDVHMDILQRRLPLKLSLCNLPADGVESFDNGQLFLLGEHADFAKHRRVGDGTEDVVAPQPPIERNGFSKPGDIRAKVAEESSAA